MGSLGDRYRGTRDFRFRIQAALNPAPATAHAPGRIRTCDRRIRSPVLCPLSYGGSRVWMLEIRGGDPLSDATD
jgi:hypothetical protein